MIKSNFFNEMNYLPLTWKPRKDYINSGVFPFYLLKKTKKIESFRKLSCYNNNYLSGSVFSLSSYPLIIRYFVSKFSHSFFIYQIPQTVLHFFSYFYPTYNNKYRLHRYFLRDQYSSLLEKELTNWEREEIQIQERKKRIMRSIKKQEKSVEEKEILDQYHYEELCMNTYIFEKTELKKEIINHYFMKKECKIRKRSHKKIKEMCLDQIKRKLPRRIRNVILPYQLETIYFFKKKGGRILVGDEMGLGKTLQSISIFSFFKLYPVLIVCPASLKTNWLCEIKKFVPFLDPSKILRISSSNDVPNDLKKYKIIILSFHMFRHTFHFIRFIQFQLLVVDESHHIRSVHSGKESQLTNMMGLLTKQIKRVVFLSGTPSVNRPINLFHQIYLLIQNDSIFCNTKFIFGEEFCKRSMSRGERKYEENLRAWEFSLFLKKTVLIRRHISSVLDSLQFLQLKRFFVFLPQEVKNEMKEKENEVETNRREKLNKIYQVKLTSKKEEEGILKIKEGIEWIESHFPNEKKILLCYHLVICKCIEDELLKRIAKKNMVQNERDTETNKIKLEEEEKEEDTSLLDYVVINGKVSEKHKVERINYFKTNQTCTYAICTIGSVSHGFDFTFSNLCFFFELPVNFFHLQQCESRIFRRNQTKDTYVFYFLLRKGLGSDYNTWNRFLKCANATHSVVDGVNFDHSDLQCSLLNEQKDTIKSIKETTKQNQEIKEKKKLLDNTISNQNHCMKKSTYSQREKTQRKEISQSKKKNEVKKYINKSKEKPIISLMKYQTEGKKKDQLKFERYLKNVVLLHKTYVKAYLEMSFRGKFKNFYYQEYDETNNAFYCLFCTVKLPYSESRIVEETKILEEIEEKAGPQELNEIKEEMKKIKERNNIKKIILCKETDLFCNGNCRKEYFIRKSSTSIRRLIYERDEGICASCNLDTKEMMREIERMKYVSLEDKIEYFIKKNPNLIQYTSQLKRIILDPKGTEGYLWQADHILPVMKGGGIASFDNLQTLCIFCHLEKTKKDLKDGRHQMLKLKEKKSKYFN